MTIIKKNIVLLTEPFRQTNMTNISNKNTKSKDYKIAYKQLVSLIAKLKNKNASYLIEELFTEAEQIMFIKRFASVFMFKQGHSVYRVSQALGVSKSTASRLCKQYNQGKYNNLLNCINKRQTNEFLSLLNDLILAQASPKARARIMNRVI